MAEANNSAAPPSGPLRRALQIVLATLFGLPLVLLVLVVVAPLCVPVVLVYAVIERVHHQRVRRAMRRAGRLRDAAERVAALRAEGGTLIADQYAPGWAVARLWATREDVRALGPQPAIAHHADLDAPAATPAFARWCDEHCFDSERGSADLLDLSPRRAHNLFGKLTGTSPPFNTVLIYRFVEDEPTIACESCGYDLTGNESGVCPECGTEAGVPAGS